MRLILKFSLVIVGVLTIAGCTNKWVKTDSTQAEFDQDRYACLQQSQQRVGAAQVNIYGGSSINTVTTNDMLFSSCMNSKGWSLENAQNKAKNDNMMQQVNQVKAKILAMCDKNELKEYYKKTTCGADDISFEQITDTTKITAAQKTALLKQREEVASLEKELDALIIQGGEKGKKIINIETSFSRPENEKNNLDLYNEKITWGDYNKRRKEIYIETRKKRQ